MRYLDNPGDLNLHHKNWIYIKPHFQWTNVIKKIHQKLYALSVTYRYFNTNICEKKKKKAWKINNCVFSLNVMSIFFFHEFRFNCFSFLHMEDFPSSFTSLLSWPTILNVTVWGKCGNNCCSMSWSDIKVNYAIKKYVS